MFCTPILIFSGTEGVGFIIHVLSSRTHFRWYRGRRVPFSCIALPDTFWAVPRASSPVFMFCAFRLFFGGTEGVGCRYHILRSYTHFVRYRGCRVSFHVLRSWTPFGRYQGRQVHYSCFAHPDLFSAIPRVCGPVFIFCAPGHIFGET
jgi:hypothetical protein